MNMLFIMNGIGSVNSLPGVSGGDVMWIEKAKCWQRQGHMIHVFTPEAGKELCLKLGLKAIFHVFQIPNQYTVTSYFVRIIKSFSIPESLDNYEGIIYSTTEHFYDVYPALQLKKRNKSNVWVAVVHWVAPLLRKGTNTINSILFYINQRSGLRFARIGADIVLAVSSFTLKSIKEIGFNHGVFPVEAGVSFSNIREVAENSVNKRYDAVFMKRFDGTKGVFDIVGIWKDVVKTKKDAKLGMIGLGTKEIVLKLDKMVRDYGLTENIDFLGPIYDFKDKFSILSGSRLFVLPSYEENWAIVIGEAMAAGVPVVCYDISEIRDIWEDKIIWVPKGNRGAFARKVLDLLNDKQERIRLSESGIRFVKKFDWEYLATKEMEIIKRITER